MFAFQCKYEIKKANIFMEETNTDCMHLQWSLLWQDFPLFTDELMGSGIN